MATTQILSAKRRDPGQFELYRSAVSTHVAKVDALAGKSGDFDCQINSQTVGPLQLVEICSDPVVLRRSARCIARDPRNHYIVSLQRSGRCVVRHDRAEVAVSPGSLVLIDKALPFETAFHDHADRLLICIPRILLERRLNDADRFLRTSITIEKGIGRIAATYAETLLEEAGGLDPVSQTNAAAICLDLLAATLISASHLEEGAGEKFDMRRGSALILLSRVRAYVRANLARPDLDPAQIAEAHGISKRYLHALFATTGSSVGAFIREERLDRAYLDLSNPRLRDLSVTDIVLRNGFNDVPHFTRRFKMKFGVRPNTLRSGRIDVD
jgi:AraC family transcriptional activator of tynA and feaB